MVETKREISLDPMIVSAWRARGHHVGVCADWLHNPVRENGKLRPFVHPWCTARERGAKGLRLAAPRESVQPGCTAKIPLAIGALIFCGLERHQRTMVVSERTGA